MKFQKNIKIFAGAQEISGNDVTKNNREKRDKIQHFICYNLIHINKFIFRNMYKYYKTYNDEPENLHLNPIAGSFEIKCSLI